MPTETKKENRIPLRTSLLYAVAGSLWILFSDLALTLFSEDPEVITRLEIFKGWVFIGVTSVLLFLIIRRDVRIIRRSESSLRESEERFRLLSDTTASAIFIYRDKILFSNRAMEVLTGYTQAELGLMDFYEIVHKDFRHMLQEHCEAFPEGEAGPLRCEYRIIRKSGEERWVDFTSSVITYAGEPAGLGTAFDITERRHVEEELRESELRFRQLVEGVTDYEIFMLDRGGWISSWNIGAERSKGYLPEEVIGKHHSIFFTDADIEGGLPEWELKEAEENGRSEDDGWRVRKDGTRFWANVVTSALRDGKGSIVGFSKVIRDITERKISEEKLRESEERYRVIAETASDAIITIDEESRIVFANSSVHRVFGYTPGELLGQQLTVLMPERMRKRHLGGLDRYLETGERGMQWELLELPGLQRDGRELPLEISYGEFRKGEGHFFTGFIRDITERKEAEKEKEYSYMLEKFNSELETLVAERTMSLIALKLADKVRNPALVIGWTGKKLLAKGELPDKVREGLSAIVGEAGKLESTVQDFQALLKGSKSAFGYESINRIIESVIPVIEQEALRKGVRLIVDLSEEIVKLNAQKDLLKMAIFNLLRNAVEAASEGGEISVRTFAEGDNVILTVSNSGYGIPKDVLDRIFDPLYSAQTFRFGMGLPLIKQIVSEHLGEIFVESRTGEGMTFKVVFPTRWTGAAETGNSQGG